MWTQVCYARRYVTTAFPQSQTEVACAHVHVQIGVRCGKRPLRFMYFEFEVRIVTRAMVSGVGSPGVPHHTYIYYCVYHVSSHCP